MNNTSQNGIKSKETAKEDIRWVFSRKRKLWLPKKKKRIRFNRESLQNWLQILIIPFVLTVGGYLYGTWQHDTDQQRALDQQQATILQTYIDNTCIVTT